MKIKLPPYVNKAISRLNECGFECFIVGGCVRDALMHKTPNDYDLTTSATPDEMKTAFDSFKLFETGIKHGTLTVLCDRVPLEITTYRTDGEYLDGRHPESVSFSRNIRDDLSRRDFTVNAMAYSERDGLIDLFGGQDDLEKQIIRCVGNPVTRFEEDALRIMRGLRFAATLGFTIESETAKAMHSCRTLQSKVAVERLLVEFKKLITGKNASAILREFSDVIGVFIPEMLESVGFDQRSRHHCYDVYEHTLQVLDSCECDDLILRLGAYFHDIAKPRCFTLDEKGGHFYGHEKLGEEMTNEILRRLHADNVTRKNTAHLVSLHMKQLTPNEKTLRRFLAAEGEETVRRFIALGRADRLACAPHNRDTSLYDALVSLLDEILEKENCFALKDLAVHGDDLIRLGFSGKEIGQNLNALLSLVIDGTLENDKQTLIEYIEKRKATD